MWRRQEKGQLDCWCRPCRAEYKQEHYALNRERYIEQAMRRKRRLADERAAFLVEYFRTHPCVDCGERDPLVLDFDHLGEKTFSIARGLRDRSWATLLREIAKCEVRCANCHRRKTARLGGFARAVAAATALEQAGEAADGG
jgi:5-methylcytosine-specific restriction endonuclease McrA